MEVPGRFERKDKRPCRHIREESQGYWKRNIGKEVETRFLGRETEERGVENGV
jgi:hypothetical protein